MKGKKYPGNRRIKKIKMSPIVKKIFIVDLESANLIPARLFLIQLNVEASSAVPNTAGITVEKLSDANRKYSVSVKNSLPI